jgi:two-component system chemotaxis response regulator CheY
MRPGCGSGRYAGTSAGSVNVGTMSQNNNLRAGEPGEADLLLDTMPSSHILVVDDEALIRRFNAEVLIGAGYLVDVADNGRSAWDMLQSSDYDLLITDQKMQRMSGIELLLRLHASRRSLSTIMASGMMPAEELKRYPWLQVHAWLTKPCSITQLLVTVEEVLHATTAAHGQMELPFYVQHQPPQNELREWRL